MKQSEVLAPTPIKYPVAYAGLKNNIPLLPTGTNHASITEGFPEMTMKPLKAGGLPPRGEDMNGLFYLTTDQKAFFQDGGYITFDTAVSMLIGGYPKGAILDYYNESTNYYTKVTSLIDDNTNNFVENPALIDGINWQFVDFGTGANENLSNISSLALDRINQSKALITGNVANYEEELSQITQMAHSTFDLSKFTVVGSPNITNDGTASGFSSGNYLTGNFPTVTPQKELIVKLLIKLNSIPTSANRLWTCGQNAISFFIALYPSDFACRLDGDSNLIVITRNTDITWDINQDIMVELKINPTTTYFTVECNGNSITKDAPTNASFISMSSFDLGGIYSYFTSGSIDLKQFSITVDGVEVFSGNKTGIDTIKPDNYTVVGSPVITPDGVASGFVADTNYLIVPILPENDFILQFEFNTNETINDGQYLFRALGMYTSSSINLFKLYYPSNGTLIADVPKQVNSKYKITIQKTGLNIITSWNINGTTISSATKTLTSNTNSHTTLSIGEKVTSSNTYFDLNAFKIYVDGNLVYQPCLKIPYTESKTGSKIVQSNYRDRVNDMYEQFGYAPYYTLDEDNGNFTLPQGELYGYLEKRARDIAHPIAQPFYRFSDEINEDEVRLEGAEVDKGLYLAIEQDPYLSVLCTAGSTADKICLPDFRNRVIYGDVVSGYIEPELPNITGGYKHYGWNGMDYFGAVTGYSVPFYVGTDAGQSTTNGMNFDASRSSSIYKDGGTVKTAGVKARWLCRWK